MRDAPARVLHLTDAGGIVLDACVFYPGRGGQPGDSGRLDWDGADVQVVMAVKGEAGQVILLPAEPVALPGPGTPVLQPLDRVRRYWHMRVHGGLRLLSVMIPLPVTGWITG